MSVLVRAGLVVALTAAAAAGTAGPADLFGGFSSTRLGEDTYHGWNAAFTFGLGGKLGLTADLAGHYASADDTDLGLFTYLAGPRLQIAGRDKVRLYVHLLGGRARASAKYSPVTGVDITQSETSTAVLAGLAADFSLSESWAFRLSASYFGVDAEPEMESQPRLSLGLSYRLGSGK